MKKVQILSDYTSEDEPNFLQIIRVSKEMFILTC